MAAHAPEVDIARLKRSLDEVNAFGRNPETGGFNRTGFSDADMAVRRWFLQTLEAEGLRCWSDGAGNVFGRLGPEDGPCIMVGSHLDTVPEGGAFDGALGVCVGLECIRAIRESGRTPRIAIEVVATAEEEGRFGGMLGSQAITGQARPDWIAAAKDAQGVTLGDAMRKQGLDPAGIARCARPASDIAAFLELHIEQGPVLEAASTPIGIATAVSGVCNLHVRLSGRANHSGTTPMSMRADAFAGLARIGVAIPEIIRDHGGEEARVTIGQVELQPNFPHTVPGRADFSIILRDTTEQGMRAMKSALTGVIGGIARDQGLSVDIDERSWIAPVLLDQGLVATLREEAVEIGIPSIEMTSGAGHDAQTMQALCPSALIFVPSRDGVSHAPEEWTDWADIEKGAALMLAAVARLSRIT